MSLTLNAIFIGAFLLGFGFGIKLLLKIIEDLPLSEGGKTQIRRRKDLNSAYSSTSVNKLMKIGRRYPQDREMQMHLLLNSSSPSELVNSIASSALSDVRSSEIKETVMMLAVKNVNVSEDMRAKLFSQLPSGLRLESLTAPHVAETISKVLRNEGVAACHTFPSAWILKLYEMSGIGTQR